MQERLTYSTTSVNEINKVMAGLFAPKAEGEKGLTKAAQTSCILVATSKEDLNNIDSLLSWFAQVHPSRFFILHADPDLNEVKAEVAACCYLVSGREKVCCEVIRLSAPPQNWSYLPNIVRANLCTGMAAELFIHSPGIRLDAIDSIGSFVDSVIFDSGDFEGNYEAINHLRRFAAQMVDLQWVRLGMWRDQLKGTFDRPAFGKLLSSVRRIVIKATARQSDRQAACSLLMAGWISHALGLEPSALGASGFELQTEGGRKVEIALENTPDPRDTRLSEIEMYFEPYPGCEAPRISIRRSNLLETVVELDQFYKLSRPLDDESPNALIKRYFLIGESTTNYPAALRLAMEMDDLQRGFHS